MKIIFSNNFFQKLLQVGLCKSLLLIIRHRSFQNEVDIPFKYVLIYFKNNFFVCTKLCRKTLQNQSVNLSSKWPRKWEMCKCKHGKCLGTGSRSRGIPTGHK